MQTLIGISISSELAIDVVGFRYFISDVTACSWSVGDLLLAFEAVISTSSESFLSSLLFPGDHGASPALRVLVSQLPLPLAFCWG